MRRIVSVLLLSFLLVATAHADHLVILHSNDSHGALFAPDAGSAIGDVGGIARVASAVRQVRTQCPGEVLLLHAGDVLSRGDVLTVGTRGRVNFELMKHIGYDVMTPGNGDFYGGVLPLIAAQRQAALPMIHANIAKKASGELLFPPYVLRKVNGIRIAVLGLGVVRMEHPLAKPLAFRDPLAEAAHYVPGLRRKADLVVVLSHLGYEADQALAARVPGIDLIVGGHSHTVLHEPLRVAGPDGTRDVVIVQAGNLERFLGRVDIDVDKRAGRVESVHIESHLIPLDASVTPDANVLAVLQKELQPLTEVLGSVREGLAHPKEGESPMALWVAAQMRDAVGADAALVERSGVSAPLEPGEVTLADIYRVTPYRNSVVLVEMSVAQFRSALQSPLAFAAAGTPAPSVDGSEVLLVAMTEFGHGATPGMAEMPAASTGARLDHVIIAGLRAASLAVGEPRAAALKAAN